MKKNQYENLGEVEINQLKKIKTLDKRKELLNYFFKLKQTQSLQKEQETIKQLGSVIQRVSGKFHALVSIKTNVKPYLSNKKNDAELQKSQSFKVAVSASPGQQKISAFNTLNDQKTNEYTEAVSPDKILNTNESQYFEQNSSSPMKYNPILERNLRNRSFIQTGEISHMLKQITIDHGSLINLQLEHSKKQTLKRKQLPNTFNKSQLILNQLESEVEEIKHIQNLNNFVNLQNHKQEQIQPYFNPIPNIQKVTNQNHNSSQQNRRKFQFSIEDINAKELSLLESASSSPTQNIFTSNPFNCRRIRQRLVKRNTSQNSLSYQPEMRQSRVQIKENINYDKNCLIKIPSNDEDLESRREILMCNLYNSSQKCGQQLQHKLRNLSQSNLDEGKVIKQEIQKYQNSLKEFQRKSIQLFNQYSKQ